MKSSSHDVFTWKTAQDGLLILAGSLVQALSMRLFLVPGEMVSGGVSGAAQIINHFTHWPIGLMVFLGNVPLFLVGWRYLGGRRFALRTAWAVASSWNSFSTEHGPAMTWNFLPPMGFLRTETTELSRAPSRLTNL